MRKEPSDESVEQKIWYETPEGSVKTCPHGGVLPGGKAEALAEDIVEMEADEEVPEVREAVEAVVTPDEEPVALKEDAGIAVKDAVVADSDAEELPLSLVAELKELGIGEVPELPEERLMLALMLLLELTTTLEDKAVVAELVAEPLTELNLPGNRFR